MELIETHLHESGNGSCSALVTVHAGHNTACFDVATAGVISHSFANQIDRLFNGSFALVAQVDDAAGMTRNLCNHIKMIYLKKRRALI